MTFGVTEDGFNGKTFEDVTASVEARARELFGMPNLDIRDPDGFLSSVYLPLNEEIADIWEILAILAYVIDPARATRQSFAAVAALRGVKRKAASVGKHPGVTMVFDDAVTGTIERGEVRFHVTDQPENVWINSEDFVINAAGSFVVAVESELPGASKILLDGASTEVVSGPAELSTVTVSEDATAGTDLETEAAWRARGEAAINEEQTTVGSALEDIDGVVAARVVTTPGYLRAIINDGGAVANDVLAQAILDSKAEGVATLGALSGTAIDEESEQVTIYFDRVVQTAVHVKVTISAPAGYSAADLRNAIIAAAPKTSGKDLIWSKLNAAAQGVAGVDDVIELLIGTIDPPTAEENLSADVDQQYTIASADIDIVVSS